MIVRGTRFLTSAVACCLLALGVSVCRVRAQIESRTQSSSTEGGSVSAPRSDWSLAVPKPAVDSRELSPAFTKAVPRSTADLKEMEDVIKGVVSRVSAAVVAVEVGFGSGSGVIISADGLVLTAGHVCGRPNREVRFIFPDGKTAYGKTVGVDLESDTGLMRITSPGPWPHVPTGDLGQADLGNWVLALGHPGGFDLQRSLVVRLGRIVRLAPGIVQTDCTISSGDSGGPLFDMHGRVIAIHSAISTSVADNFHVPITRFYSSWNQLIRTEAEKIQARSPKAYLGAVVNDDGKECRLTRVDPGSPAFNAGLKPGDFILKVDEREIKASASFRRWLAESEPGETLTLEVKRGEKVFPLDVKLQPPPRAASAMAPKRLNQEP